MNPRCFLCRNIGVFVILLGLCVSSAQGQIITLGAGVKNPPDPLTSIASETAKANKAVLVGSAHFNAILEATLDVQGYTANNNWVYSFTSPPLPTGLFNPATLPRDAAFNITEYELSLNEDKKAFGETFNFTLRNPPPGPVLAGATITQHWLSVIHMNERYGDFGYAIPDKTGFWQVDNGDVTGSAHGRDRGAVGGAGPYYDSNAPDGGFSVPYSFHDFPHYYSHVRTHLNFTTIPAWDVCKDGRNYVIVGDTGICWGFGIVDAVGQDVLKKGNDVNAEKHQLEGTWRAIAIELGGKEIDPQELADYRLVFSGDQCSIVSGKRGVKCTFTIDPSKTPKWIDVTRTADKVSWPGIYQLDGATLKVFLDRTGGKRPTEFKTKEGTQQVIRTYERVKP